jgi:hypothetical protein
VAVGKSGGGDVMDLEDEASELNENNDAATQPIASFSNTVPASSFPLSSNNTVSSLITSKNALNRDNSPRCTNMGDRKKSTMMEVTVTILSLHGMVVKAKNDNRRENEVAETATVVASFLHDAKKVLLTHVPSVPVSLLIPAPLSRGGDGSEKNIILKPAVRWTAMLSTFTFERLFVRDEEEEGTDDDLRRRFVPQTCPINLSISVNNSNMAALGKIDLIINGEENGMTPMCVPIVACKPKTSGRILSVVSPMKKQANKIRKNMSIGKKRSHNNNERERSVRESNSEVYLVGDEHVVDGKAADLLSMPKLLPELAAGNGEEEDTPYATNLLEETATPSSEKEMALSSKMPLSSREQGEMLSSEASSAGVKKQGGLRKRGTIGTGGGWGVRQTVGGSIKTMEDKLRERQHHEGASTPMIIKGNDYNFGLDKSSMLCLSVSVSNPFNNRKQQQSPPVLTAVSATASSSTTDQVVTVKKGGGDSDEDDEQSITCLSRTYDSNDDNDSLLSLEEQDDYRYILQDYETRTLRQQLLLVKHKNTEMQLELDDAHHAIDDKGRMVASLQEQNETLRAELNQTTNNAATLLNELNASKADSEILPFFESRVNELLNELKKRDLEVLCLKEELDELRGHYKDHLSVSVEGLLWDHHDDQAYDGTNNSCYDCGDESGVAVQERISAGLSSAAVSSLLFGRKLAKVIEEKVVTRDKHDNFQDDDDQADTSLKSPLKKENFDLDSICDVGGVEKAVGPLLPSLLPERTGIKEAGDDNNKSSEGGGVSSLEKEVTRTPSENLPPLKREWSERQMMLSKTAIEDNDVTKSGVGGGPGGGGWGVRRLGASLMTMEEKMRERQQLFREQQQRALAEQQRQVELERLNAAPGLGGVLRSRMSNKSDHAERQQTDLKDEEVKTEKTRSLIPPFAVEALIEDNESTAVETHPIISCKDVEE